MARWLKLHKSDGGSLMVEGDRIAAVIQHGEGAAVLVTGANQLIPIKEKPDQAAEMSGTLWCQGPGGLFFNPDHILAVSDVAGPDGKMQGEISFGAGVLTFIMPDATSEQFTTFLEESRVKRAALKGS